MTTEQKQTLDRLNAKAIGQIVRNCRAYKKKGYTSEQLYNVYQITFRTAVDWITTILKSLGLYQYWNAQELDHAYYHYRYICGLHSFTVIRSNHYGKFQYYNWN